MRRPKPHIHGRDHAPGGSDPIRGLGGDLPTFALTGGVFYVTDTPVLLDSDLLGTDPDFSTTDTGTFDMTANGHARILREGMYVTGCQINVQTPAAVTFNTWVYLHFEYEDGRGYYIEIPWLESGFHPTGTLYGEEVAGTRYVFPNGDTSGHDVALQRIHPISLTAAMVPLEIQPGFVTNADAISVRWLGLWGFRLSGHLANHSG